MKSWLANRDPFNGLLWFLYNWVVLHPVHNLTKRGQLIIAQLGFEIFTRVFVAVSRFPFPISGPLGCNCHPKRNLKEKKNKPWKGGEPWQSQHGTTPLRIWAKSADGKGMVIGVAICFGKASWFQTWFFRTEDSSRSGKIFGTRYQRNEDEKYFFKNGDLSSPMIVYRKV